VDRPAVLAPDAAAMQMVGQAFEVRQLVNRTIDLRSGEQQPAFDSLN
jgi:hypothetical protein